MKLSELVSFLKCFKVDFLQLCNALAKNCSLSCQLGTSYQLEAF